MLIYNLFALCTGKHEPQLAARRVIDAHIFITVLEEEAAILGQRFASHVLGSKDAQPSAPVRRDQHGAIVVRGLGNREHIRRIRKREQEPGIAVRRPTGASSGHLF